MPSRLRQPRIVQPPRQQNPSLQQVQIARHIRKLDGYPTHHRDRGKVRHFGPIGLLPDVAPTAREESQTVIVTLVFEPQHIIDIDIGCVCASRLAWISHCPLKCHSTSRALPKPVALLGYFILQTGIPRSLRISR